MARYFHSRGIGTRDSHNGWLQITGRPRPGLWLPQAGASRFICLLLNRQEQSQ